MEKKTEAGKGDSTRPCTVTSDEYSLRWELAFKKISKKRENEIYRILKKIEKEKKSGI